PRRNRPEDGLLDGLLRRTSKISSAHELPDRVRKGPAPGTIAPRIELDWSRDVPKRANAEQRRQSPPSCRVGRHHAVRGEVVAEGHGQSAAHGFIELRDPFGEERQMEELASIE